MTIRRDLDSLQRSNSHECSMSTPLQAKRSKKNQIGLAQVAQPGGAFFLSPLLQGREDLRVIFEPLDDWSGHAGPSPFWRQQWHKRNDPLSAGEHALKPASAFGPALHLDIRPDGDLGHDLVAVDETTVTTKIIQHYGRPPRGKRLVGYVPQGHWKTLMLVAALRIDGLTAPYIVDGA